MILMMAVVSLQNPDLAAVGKRLRRPGQWR